jgi:putative sterol carrier protein
LTYTFLSDDWLDAVKKIQDELGGGEGADVTINLSVTGGPEGDRDLHLANGVIAAGQVDARTRLVLPYSVARQMFIEGNQQAAMQAFMAGTIKIEGDMAQVMAVQNSGALNSPELTERIKEITAV